MCVAVRTFAVHRRHELSPLKAQRFVSSHALLSPRSTLCRTLLSPSRHSRLALLVLKPVLPSLVSGSLFSLLFSALSSLLAPLLLCPTSKPTPGVFPERAAARQPQTRVAARVGCTPFRSNIPTRFGGCTAFRSNIGTATERSATTRPADARKMPRSPTASLPSPTAARRRGRGRSSAATTSRPRPRRRRSTARRTTAIATAARSAGARRTKQSLCRPLLQHC